MHGVSGIVLAGGLGRRMGGVDKGLQPLHGKAMVEHVLARLAPQVDEIVINANQNLEIYRAFGYRVVSDEIGGFAGPLAPAPSRCLQWGRCKRASPPALSRRAAHRGRSPACR